VILKTQITVHCDSRNSRNCKQLS